MPIDKQNVNISFEKGMDLKSDPFQIPIGNFESLKNTVFTKNKLLQKRNGFGSLPALPDTTSTYLTTFNNNLTAVGTSLTAYDSGSQAWFNKGTLRPSQLSVMPLIRNNYNQSYSDSAISNGLICTAYTETQTGSTVYRYAIANVETGQNIVAPTTLSSANGSPKVWALGGHFIIVFKSTTANHLQYVAITILNPTSVSAATDISTVYSDVGGTQYCFGGVVFNDNLYIAYNATDGGNAIRMTYLDSGLTQHGNVILETGNSGLIFSLCGDSSTNYVYIFYYTQQGGSNAQIYGIVVNQGLQIVKTQTTIKSETVDNPYLNLASAAQNGSATLFYEKNYFLTSHSGLDQSNEIKYATFNAAGTVAGNTAILETAGLASKAFIINSVIYVLVAYQSPSLTPYQNTYFLIDSSGNIIAKLAYSNGGGYLTKGLPNVNVNDDTAQFTYLFKDLIQSQNKGTALPSGTQSAGIYTQTGINLATISINSDNFVSSEIGNNLILSGGLTSSYDGYSVVEQGFHLYPDQIQVTWTATGGSIVAKPDGSTNTNAYYYVVVYEWSDNQGNIFRSAPSIPVAMTTTGSASTGSASILCPYLMLTAKTSNPVKIVVYRWSVAQQSYYQVTSITAPIINVTTGVTHDVSIPDTSADSTILGNNLLYTTGGVIENVAPPASTSLALSQSRVFLIDAEDQNLLWYSKQVIEATPVEMSDLFTIYVAPTTAAQGNTGPMKCISALDDKTIIFKKNAIYYITGKGPDNTGANNDFSDPVFVTSTVGCSNQNSIVFMPNGLMFQSDKGIWLLDRNLSTSYIGAPVEDFNEFDVLSALCIPGTNQVRLTMSDGTKLMYDYFYGQWGTFTGSEAISSTLFEDKETFIDSYGRAFQETEGLYLDGTTPTVMSLKTGWINLAGLQGYERAYFFYLLGKYLTPHILTVQIAYDYNPSPTQTVTISPDNFSSAYGGDSLYGGSAVYGGSSKVEQWRVFFSQQKCEAFQITINESYDPSFGAAAGAGLTLSGLDLVVGLKKAYPVLKDARSVG